MENLDPEALADVVAEAYQLPTPMRITPLTSGANNRSFLIETNTGDFILKWHHNIHAIKQIGFQNLVLNALQAEGLPFAVPAPIRSKHGAFASSTRIHDEPVTLSLTHRIPGKHPGVGDTMLTYACGKGLGILDDALARVTLPANTSAPIAFPPLALNHPAVPDPLSAIQSELGRDDLSEMLLAIENDVQSHTANWDQQLIHGDFFSPNVLVSDGEVSGVLDFEFLGMGHRAMDFAVGLKAFCLNPAPSTNSWKFLRAFATGYLAHAYLSPAELRAIPTLLLKRETSSFVHWLGRMLEGLTDHQDLEERADRLTDLVRWVNTSRSELVALLEESRPDG